MMIFAALALAAATMLAPVQNAPSVMRFDVVGNVFSADQRKMIERDSRCKDASDAADAFAKTDGKDMAVAVTALKTIEHCAEMSRVGEWNDFRDYLWTAAAGVAYDIGIVAAEPKGLQHSIAAARNVEGFQAPNVQTDLVTMKPGGLGSGKERMGAEATAALAPISNNRNYETTVTHASGYKATYGQLATQIAQAAENALSISGGAGTK